MSHIRISIYYMQPGGHKIEAASMDVRPADPALAITIANAAALALHTTKKNVRLDYVADSGVVTGGVPYGD